MKIRELIQQNVVSVDVGDSLFTAAENLRTYDVGALAVVRDGQLAGVVSERDLVTAMVDGADPILTEIGDYMTGGPLTAELSDDSEEVINRMVEAGIRHMPIVRDRRPVGMVSLRDLIVLAVWPSMGGAEEG